MTTNPQLAPESKPALLVVDDDPLITDTLAFALGTEYTVYTCESRPQAIELLRQLDAPPPLALVDLGLPPAPHDPVEGFRLIADLLAHSPRMKIFVLSGQNDAANARHARALGAWEFVAKPADPASLARALARGLEVPVGPDADFVGASPALTKLKSQIAQFAAAPYPVLIEGESGSGKELVAGAPAPPLAARRPPVLQPELRGDLAPAGRADAVRLRQGGVHRRAVEQGRVLRGRRRRHPVPRRDRRAAARHAGEAAARAGERRVPARRRDPAPHRALPRDRRHQPRPAPRAARGRVPRRSLSPALGLHAERAAAARAGQRQAPAAATFSKAPLRARRCVPFELDESAAARWLRYDFPGNVRELRNIVIRLSRQVPRPAHLGRGAGSRNWMSRKKSRTQNGIAAAGAAPARARRAVRPRPDAQGLGARLHRGRAAPDARQRHAGREAARHQPHHALQPYEQPGEEK